MMRNRRNPSRREVLSGLGSLPVLGILSGASSQAVGSTEAGLITGLEREECARLKALDLSDEKTAAQRKNMPMGKIGGLTVSRLISGSNLISLNMHARDLDYVSELAAHYNTQERVFMTLKKCEEYGVNTIILKNHNFVQFDLSKYWQEWGGKMQWIADVITTEIDKYEELLVEHLELGASGAYLWGGASDIWYYQKKQDNIVKAFEIMKKYNIPAGIGAHRLEPIQFCEKEGLAPDFYLKTLHHDKYWSAHPKENRRYMEMFEKESDKHGEFHDNFWCYGHEEVAAFMQEVKAPWIAFKILAAGAIAPQEGFKYAFESGADFVCVGMFDFQVKEDAELAVKSVAESSSRRRAWRG